MHSSAYDIEAEVEISHWWFVGRRRLFAKELQAARGNRDLKVLDIGSSTGTNLRMLKEELRISQAIGVDFSIDALKYCKEKNLGILCGGDISCLPFVDQSFDLVLATDVIEHVEDDDKALQEIRRVLTSSGKALITVPTFSSLWGLQDDVAFHKRRYRLQSLSTKVSANRLKIEKAYYFNYLLFFPIWIVRQLIRWFQLPLKNENQLNNRLLNAVFKVVFFIDVMTARKFHPPFGVSALLIVTRG